MIREEKNKISIERKVIYIVIILIIFLLLLFLREIEIIDSQYDNDLYAEVYKEYNEILVNSQGNGGNENTQEKMMYNNVNEEVTIVSSNSKRENNKDREYEYNKVEAILEINKINLFYPIISETTYENLKIVPTKFHGCKVNEVGNYCIVGYNNRDNEQFSNLNKLEIGDKLNLTGRTNGTIQYVVYEKYVIELDDLSCTTQLTSGNKIVTLITCTNNGKQRLVLKCKEVI